MSSGRRLMLCVCLLVGAAPDAQQLPDPQLRAAYLFNFAKFTEWPATALPPSAPLVICTDDARVFGALRDAVTDKTIGERSVVAREIGGWSDASTCQIAYVRRRPGASEAKTIEPLARSSVFTIGDDGTVIDGGGVAHFFVEEQRLRFVIATTGAQRAGLTISSRLMTLAVVRK